MGRVGREGSLVLPVSSFSSWSRLARHIMASEAVEPNVRRAVISSERRAATKDAGFPLLRPGEGQGYRQGTELLLLFTSAVQALAGAESASDQRKGSPVSHMQCIITASLRATAILAFF